MYRLIEAWRQSGQLQSKFCHKHGVSHSKFKYWIAKRNKEQEGPKEPEPSGPGFAPARLDIPHPVSTYKIEYPNGVCLHCPGATDHLQLKQLIRLY